MATVVASFAASVSNMPSGAVITIDSPWLAAGFASAIAVLAALGIRRVWGTTLTAPAGWALVGALAIAAIETYLALENGGERGVTQSLLRYAGSVSMFCPIMAVLGSKRPQDRGWQWVVLSMWIVLLVPAGQALAAPSGERLELAGVWHGLIIALMAMELLNYLPTRNALAALLAASGQAFVLLPYLVNDDVAGRWRSSGLLMILVAAVVEVTFSAPRVRRTQSSSDSERLYELQRRWFEFRDRWGAFWGLRVLQRINQTAELSHWPVRLHWSQGLTQVGDGGALGGAVVAHVEQTFNSLLRRFERLE